MTREDPYRIQAALQRKRMTRIEFRDEYEETPFTVKQEKDVLPPRSEVHHNKKRKKKKFKNPIITILAIIFILLPIVLLSIPKWQNHDWFSSIEPTNHSTNQFEQVNIDSNSQIQNTEEISEEEIIEQETNPLEETTTDSLSKSEDIDATNKDAIEENNDTSLNDNSINKQVITTIVAESETTATEPEIEKEQMEEESTSETSNKDTVIYHTVGNNETLFRIAMKYFQSKNGIEIIKQANGLTSNDIQAGQVLKIPTND